MRDRSGRRGRGVSLAGLLLLLLGAQGVACGGDDEPAGARDAGRDAARGDSAVGMDGGTPPGDDGGTPPGDDGGTPPGDDGGTPPGDDGGTPPVDDGGTPPVDDGGTPPVDDGGTPPVDDGGTPPVDDGGTPPGDDGGTPPGDMGPVADMGPVVDMGPVADMGPVDAGTRDAGSGGCFSNADCRDRTQYCETATCGGAGVCLSRPSFCAGVIDPVCGCDDITYGNDCERQRAGVGRASLGACAGACDLRPPALTCCYETPDCTRGQTCVATGGAPAPMCVAGSEGVCKGTPPAGACWDDSDCGTGESCEGERVCPCGALCPIIDVMGTCRAVDCSMRPTIAGCCFRDSDCTSGTRCYTEVCASGTQGRCLPPPSDRLHCWEDADCSIGIGGTFGRCAGQTICACGADCGGRVDTAGTCTFAP